MLPGTHKPPRREPDVQTILSFPKPSKEKPQQIKDHEEKKR